MDSETIRYWNRAIDKDPVRVVAAIRDRVQKLVRTSNFFCRFALSYCLQLFVGAFLCLQSFPYVLLEAVTEAAKAPTGAGHRWRGLVRAGIIEALCEGLLVAPDDRPMPVGPEKVGVIFYFSVV